MKRTPLTVLATLLLLLCQLGCDKGNDTSAPQQEGTTQVQTSPDAPPPTEPIGQTPIIPTGTAQPSTSGRLAPLAEEAPIASAYIVIQNAGPRNPQQLVQQLQQVLPKTQVVKQVQSPNPREIKLEVTNVKDVRALANKIPFGAVEAVDDRARTITIDFDL